MRDGLVRRCLKGVALFHFRVNLGLHRALRRAKGERPYLLGGSCGRCASCCKAPTIAVGSLVWFLPTLRGMFLAWHHRVNGFLLVERQRSGRLFVFRCTHFDEKSRSCDSYASRPGMCRDYPRILLWGTSPEFLKGCGYTAKLPGAAKMRERLKGTSLTEEERERLERDLLL